MSLEKAERDVRTENYRCAEDITRLITEGGGLMAGGINGKVITAQERAEVVAAHQPRLDRLTKVEKTCFRRWSRIFQDYEEKLELWASLKTAANVPTRKPKKDPRSLV